MKNGLGRYSRKEMREDLDEFDKWYAGKASAFRKVPVPPVDKEVVKELRLKSGLTQSKFAAALGLNPSTVRFWESGRRSPDGLARKVLRMLDKKPQLFKDLAMA